MADTVVHMGENSPEYVALKLFDTVAKLEKKELSHSPANDWEMATRKWVLDAYAECLDAVKGYRKVKKND